MEYSPVVAHLQAVKDCEWTGFSPPTEERSSPLTKPRTEKSLSLAGSPLKAPDIDQSFKQGLVHRKDGRLVCKYSTEEVHCHTLSQNIPKGWTNASRAA